MSEHLITLMVLLPVLGAIAQAFITFPPTEAGGSRSSWSNWVTLAASLGSSLCGIVLVVSMHTQTAELQSAEILQWVGSFAISYHMGLDGLNALMVLLIAIIFPLLIAAEWAQPVGRRGMHGLLLVLQASMAGAVCAQDLFLLFFFWALTALPFYFLIGIWGGEKRESAAFRSIVAASIGNGLFFAALVLIYYSVDPHTFSVAQLAGGKLGKETFLFLGQELPVSPVAFGLICAGLALRAPVWPLQGWFVHAAEESPPSVIVALSAVSVPVTLSIFVRLAYSLFPDTVAQWAGGIVTVGAISLILGVICAVAQRGLRLLYAYIALAQVGFVLLGVGSLNSAGIVGAIYQMFSTGLALAGFGLFVGVIARRTGRNAFLLEDGTASMGGVATQAPMTAFVAGVVVAALLGFPGLSGFVGSSLLMIGSYSVHPAALLLAGGALLLITYCLLTMYRHVFLGTPASGAASGAPTPTPFPDLSPRERSYLLPIVICILIFGVYPKPLIELIRPTVLTLLSTVK